MLSIAYRKLHYLSLDIVCGAVILLRFFSQELKVYVSLPIYAILGITVWLIYTIDHLRDANQSREPMRGRYLFHLSNSRVLRFTTALGIIVICLLLFFVERDILWSGFLLAGLSSLYLVVQQTLARWCLKELYVAVIYTSGILLAPFVLNGGFEWLIWLKLFLLTYINLVLFSRYEKEEDLKDQFHSIATMTSDAVLEKLLFLLLTLGFLLLFLFPLDRISLFFLFGFILYTMMTVERKWSSKNQRYRLIGDGVFLLPILFEWL